MNSPTAAAAISGLLSLVSEALDPESSTSGTRTALPAAPAQGTDLSAALGQLLGGWAAVREDGHGWVLLHFAPGAEPAPRTEEPAPETRPTVAHPGPRASHQSDERLLALVPAAGVGTGQA